MGLGTTSWLQVAPVVLVAALLVMGPGSVAARIAGYGWTDALGIGPLLTTGLLTVAGLAAGKAHLSWGVLTLAISVGVLLLGAVLLRAVTSRGHPRSETPARGSGSPVVFVASSVAAFAAVTAVVVASTGRPTAFPQSPDTIFHLDSIRWMLEQHDISALQAAGFSTADGSGFYPAAFHGIAANVALLTGCSPVVAASVTALVTSALVWPTGLLVLTRRLLGPSPSTLAAAALASVAFAAYPYWLMGYGVLWPFVLGQAVQVAALVLVVDVADGPGRVRSLVLLGAGLPGLAMAHPNALAAFGLMGAAVIIGCLLRAAHGAWPTRRAQAVRWLVLAAAGLGVLAAGWAVVTERSIGMRNSNPRGPEMSAGEGIVDVLFFAPRDLPPLWVTGVLVMVGVVVLLVRRRAWWVVSAHVGVIVGYLMVTLVDNRWTRLFTWPWYNNSPRLAALMVLTGALLFAAAASTALQLVPRVLPRRARELGVVATLAGMAVATLVLAWPGQLHALGSFYSRTPSTSFATTQELDALRAFGRIIPPDARVAANPWKGAPFIYLTSGRELLFATEKTYQAGDRELLGRHLAEAAHDPRVCAAARRQQVEYVITGGSSMTASRAQAARYAGIDAVAGAPGFTGVASQGGYELWRIDACD